MKRLPILAYLLPALLLGLSLTLSSFQPPVAALAEERTPSATAQTFGNAEGIDNGTVLGDPEEPAEPTAVPDSESGASATPEPATPEAVSAPEPPVALQEAEIAQAGLQINVIAPTTVRAGAPLTYTILYTNTGTAAANTWMEVGLSPALTPAAQVYSYTVEAPAQDEDPADAIVDPKEPITSSGKLFWKLGDIAAGAKGQVVFVVGVGADKYPRTGITSIVLGNTSRMRFGGTSGQIGNADNSGTLVAGPVFVLNKVPSPSKVLAGQEVTFTITVGNATAPNDIINGKRREDAVLTRNITLTDVLPANAEFRGASSGGQFDSQTKKIVWTFPQLAPGNVLTVTVRMALALTGTSCDNLNGSNYVVTSDDMPFVLNSRPPARYEIKGPNSTATIQSPVVLEVVANPTAVFANQRSTITVRAKSYWPQAISGMTLTVSNLNSPVQPSPSGGSTPSVDGNTVTWRNVVLPAGNPITPSVTLFTFGIQYDRNIGQRRSTAAVELPASIVVPTSCLRSVFANVDVKPLIVLTKTASNVLPEIGEPFQYTIEVENVSDQAVSSIVVTDSLNNNANAIFEFIDMVTGPRPDQTAGSSIITWRLAGSLAPGQTTTLTFRAKGYGQAGATACYFNGVSADATETQINPINSARVCLKPPFDIQKTITPAVVDPTGTNRDVTVTIAVREIYRPETVTSGKVYLLDDPNTLALGEDPLPDTNTSELVYVRAISSTNGMHTAAIPDDGVYWTDMALPRLGSFSVSLLFKIPASAPVGQVLTDRACVGYEPGSSERPSDPKFNFSWCIYADGSVVLSKNTVKVGKVVDLPKVSLGERVKYTLTFQNESPNIISGVTISDTLPAEFRYDGMLTRNLSPTLTTLADGRQNLNWAAPNIAAKSSISVEYYARASTFIGTYTNQVWGSSTMSGSSKPVFICANAAKCLTTSDGDIAALDVPGVTTEQRVTIEPEVITSTSQIQRGGLVDYKISIVSINNIAYNATTITVTLPIGFSFKEMLDNGPTPRIVGDKLIWSGIVVPAKGSGAGSLYQLKLRTQAPNTFGVFRLNVEATSTTGLIPTSDRAAVVVIGSDRPAFAIIAPRLAEPSSRIVLAHSAINPDSSDINVTTISTTLPAGFEYDGMVLSNTIAPAVSGSVAAGQILTWSSLVAPKMVGDEFGFILLDVWLKTPATRNTYTITSRIAASKTFDPNVATATVRVAPLRYMRFPLVQRS